MEDQVCTFFKFGFCRYKERCQRMHLEETCPDLKECQNTKLCMKRHPKVCKMVKLNKVCKFGQDCAYHHVSNYKEIFPDEDNFKMKQKMDILEKTIYNQTERIKNLEADMKTPNKEKYQHGKKLNQIEKVVQALTRKVLELEVKQQN